MLNPISLHLFFAFSEQKAAYLNTPNTFVVDTRALKAQENPIQVKCEVRSKSGKLQQAKVEKLDDGTHLVIFRPTEKGMVSRKFAFLIATKKIFVEN